MPTHIKNLLKQLKDRRLKLGLKQSDMMMRAGMSRQQYQRMESRGNPRLDTMELIAKGLNCEIALIPKEKLNAVLAVLEGDSNSSKMKKSDEQRSVSDNPWQDLMDDDL